MDQIDEKIKYLVQQDKIVSPKAEKVINDFCYEKEIEKNTIKVPKKINFMYKVRKMIAIIACIAGLLGGANVYASTNGYGNVFFLIKYIVTGDKTEIIDKNEILSDRDIAISYKPIALTENLELQIRNLQIKNNNAILRIGIKEKEENAITPLKYKILNNTEKVLCEQNSNKKLEDMEYSEEITFKGITQNDEIIKLYIYTSYDTNLAKITINLVNREVIVQGENEALEQISEIELKKYLSEKILSEYKRPKNEKVILNIKDITYCAGLYKTEINYVFLDNNNTFNLDYDNMTISDLTVYFTLYKNNMTDKFNIVKFEKENNN